MRLVDSYVEAVRLYLPRANRDDIIRELSANLQAQMEEKAGELGRPLTDEEQMALLKQHGDPMLVARRYRQDRPSLTIGWELIGPELFPMYLIFLSINLSLSIGFTALYYIAMKLPLSIDPFVGPVILQILCVTTVFIILNAIRRKYPQPWYYPPAALAPMVPVPRWSSISGLVVWTLFTAWWVAIPFYPQVLLGSSAKGLEFAPIWHRIHVPILALLLAGIAQRAYNLVRPDVTWLLSRLPRRHQPGRPRPAVSDLQELSLRPRRGLGEAADELCRSCRRVQQSVPLGFDQLALDLLFDRRSRLFALLPAAPAPLARSRSRG